MRYKVNWNLKAYVCRGNTGKQANKIYKIVYHEREEYISGCQKIMNI